MQKWSEKNQFLFNLHCEIKGRRKKSSCVHLEKKMLGAGWLLKTFYIEMKWIICRWMLSIRRRKKILEGGGNKKWKFYWASLVSLVEVFQYIKWNAVFPIEIAYFFLLKSSSCWARFLWHWKHFTASLRKKALLENANKFLS